MGFLGAHLSYLLSSLAGVGLLIAGLITVGSMGTFLLRVLVTILGMSAIITMQVYAVFRDARISTGYLKRMDGQLYQRFFQLRPKPGDAVSDQTSK